MTSTTEKAAAALELLPEEMREPAVAYLLEQAEKYRLLKELVADGMRDVSEGRVTEWSFDEFLRKLGHRNTPAILNEGLRFGRSQTGPSGDLRIRVAR